MATTTAPRVGFFLLSFSLTLSLLLSPNGYLGVAQVDVCTPGGGPSGECIRPESASEQGVIHEASQGCAPEDFGYGSTVCTCNATYCDVIDTVGEAGPGHYWVYTSSKDGGRRLEKQSRGFATQSPSDAVVWTLHRNEVLQTILGFGGSFTDSAGLNINSLSPGARRNLMRSYFSEEGIEYTMGRVPIGGADFSPRGYTYLDGHDGDFNLTNFRLAEEDFTYKIPFIREAQQMSARTIRLMASPWSPPVWMKTNGELRGRGKIKGQPGGQYYKTYARYIIRFLDEYAKHNVTFWGLSGQNEPLFGNLDRFIQIINNVLFSVTDLREFIVKDLGPMLAEAGYGDLQLMAFDDMPIFLPFYLRDLVPDASADIHKYVSGLAIHYYFNNFINYEMLTKIHRRFPNLFLLSTEACEGVLDTQKVKLGSWDRAENYALDILQGLQHWTSGWIDWNLALDVDGGPNWCNNMVDSPIIVDADKDVFYKQPMFYILAHFSKFLPAGSQVVNLKFVCPEDDLYAIAAVTPGNNTVVIILNSSDTPRTIAVQESTASNNVVSSVIPARSIQTYLW